MLKNHFYFYFYSVFLSHKYFLQNYPSIEIFINFF